MSADNWRICPQCQARDVAEKKKLDIELAASYGSISSEDWLVLKEKIDNPTQLEETLREDYEFFMGNEGLFYAKYSAQCTECGFEHDFKHEEQLKILED